MAIYFTSDKKGESEDIPLLDGDATYIAEGSFTDLSYLRLEEIHNF